MKSPPVEVVKEQVGELTAEIRIGDHLRTIRFSHMGLNFASLQFDPHSGYCDFWVNTFGSPAETSLNIIEQAVAVSRQKVNEWSQQCADQGPARNP